MAGNTFGQAFRVTTFGESHGAALGCIIDGVPAGLTIDEEFLQKEMDRRKPGTTGNAAVTARKEDDKAEILSGVFEGKSTGTPVAIIIRNTNQISKDYSNIMDKFRPGHADFTFFQKYGIRDYRGGGRSSGRETCARVAAGAIAKLFLKEKGITIRAYTKKALGIESNPDNYMEENIEANFFRCPDMDAAKKMEKAVEELAAKGDSAGGIIECVVKGLPAGLGETVFDKADALLAHGILSIGAVKGIEFGAGFEAADLYGSQNNDPMTAGGKFLSNNAGGILGGMTNGNDLVFRAAVKPVPSIYQKQQTVNTNLEPVEIEIKGRHDVCLCPRIVPVVEAMTAITIADLFIRNEGARL